MGRAPHDWGHARVLAFPRRLPLTQSRTPFPPLLHPPVFWALDGGSSGGEVLPRCLHVGEGDLHPFASPRAAFFFEQALACVKWGPLQFAHFAHGVLTPVALLDPAPLHKAPVLLRHVPLRTPATLRGGAGELRLHVAPPAAVATSGIWPFLFEGLGLVAAALEPQSSLADETVDVFALDSQNHRRCPDGSFLVASLDAWRAARPSYHRGDLDPSFSASSSSRSVSVPFDPLPRYRATGIAWILIHHQDFLASRPVNPGSTARAARITVSRCSSSCSALLVVLVEPRYLPLRVRKRSWTLALAPSRWSARLMADWIPAFRRARSSLVLPAPNCEGRVKSHGSPKHRCPGL